GAVVVWGNCQKRQVFPVGRKSSRHVAAEITSADFLIVFRVNRENLIRNRLPEFSDKQVHRLQAVHKYSRLLGHRIDRPAGLTRTAAQTTNITDLMLSAFAEFHIERAICTTFFTTIGQQTIDLTQ